MIVSTNIQEIFSAGDSPFADTVTSYLLQSDKIAAMRHGEKVTLDFGVSVLAIIAAGAEPTNKKLLEAHKLFNDLHYILHGKDTISYKPVADCSNINKPYAIEGDYILFNEWPVERLTIVENTFCFIPNDMAHMALYENNGPVHKLVFKIPAKI